MKMCAFRSTILIKLITIFSFNKKEEDFDNLNDYNDYLEKIETIGNIRTV